MGFLKKEIENALNHTVYVKSLEIGGSYVRDYESSYFIHPQKQVIHLQPRSVSMPSKVSPCDLCFLNSAKLFKVKDVCQQVKADPNLQNRSFNAIGFSQGAQFL